VTRKWPQDDPLVWPLEGGIGAAELTDELRRPTAAPCGSLAYLVARSDTSARTLPRCSQVHRLAQPRGKLGFPDDPQRDATEV
jgi:hypothetical protein